MPNAINRRDVLRGGAALTLAGVAGSGVRAGETEKPPRIGVIGVGGRGTHLLRLALAQGVDVPALCDIKPAALNRGVALVAKARQGRKPDRYGTD